MDNLTLSNITTKQVLELIGYNKPTKADSTRKGKVLMKLTGEKPIRKTDSRYHTSQDIVVEVKHK